MSHLDVANVSELFGRDSLITVDIHGGSFAMSAPHPADDIVERMCQDLMRGSDVGLNVSMLWNGFTLYVDEHSGTEAGMWQAGPSWLIVTHADFDPIGGYLSLRGDIYEKATP